MATLSILQLTYDQATLSLNWSGTGLTDSSSCWVVLNGASGSQSFAATGTSATISIDLANSGSWTAMVSVDGMGSSAAVPVPTGTTTLTRVQNNVSTVSAAWTAASDAADTYVQLSQSGSGSADGAVVDGEAYSFDTADKTLTSGTWEVSARGHVTSGTAQCYGPIAKTTLLTKTARLNRVYNSGQDVQMSWVPSGYTRFYVSLYGGSDAPQSRSVTTSSYTYTVQVSGDGWSASVSGQSSDQVSIGPPASAAVITAIPEMTAVSYGSSDLTLDWGAVDGGLSYGPTLTDGSETQSGRTSDVTYSFTGPFSGSAWRCYVCAQSSDGVSVGPQGTAYTPIFDAPTLLTFDYDGDTGALTWTDADNATATGNQLVITGGAVDLTFAIGLGGSGSVALTLDAAVSYEATVQATDGIVTGPSSNGLSLISAPPQDVFLGYDGSSLAAIWQPPDGVTATGYPVTLTADGDTAYDGTVTRTSIGFGIALATATVYGLTVRTVADVVTGPPNPVVYGPYKTGQTLTFDGFGRLTAIAWTGGRSDGWTYDDPGNITARASTTTTPAEAP